MIYKYTLLFLCCCSSLLSWAQPETTMPSMRRLYQSTYINPAFMPKYKVSVGIPILSNIYLNNTRSGFTIQDINDCVDDEGLVDLNKFYNKLDAKGFTIQTTLETDIFHASFPIGKTQLSFNSSIKTQNSQHVSKEFIGFLAQGNAFFAGQTLNVELLGIKSMEYLENGVSLARQFNKLSVGARFKYLQGIAMVDTKNIGFSVTTGANAYDPLTIKTTGSMRTGGVPLLVDSINNKEEDADLKKYDVKTLTKFANSGFGIDLGATYQATPKLMVHASVVDWGGINWKSNPYTYNLKSKDVNFAGYTSREFDSDSIRSKVTDSLTKILYESEISTKSFKTALNTRFYVGFDYNLTKRDRVGFLFQGQKVVGDLLKAYTFSYTRKFGTNWDLTANYSIFNKSNMNIGVGTAIKMGPCQLYLIQDDIMIYFKPQTGNTIYFRIGLNLVWSELKGERISSGE
jgi:hypothetical protein